MFQIRHSDGRAYNAARDIVQLFPAVIGHRAALQLSQPNWPLALREYAAHVGLTEAALIPAAAALAKFVNCVTDADVPDAQTAFVKAGMDKLPAPVLLTLLAAIGDITCGVFFKTARASNPAGRAAFAAPELGSLLDRSAHAAQGSTKTARARRAADVAKVAAPTIINNDPTA